MKQLYIIDVNIAVIISVLVVEVKRHKFIVAGVLFFSCTIPKVPQDIPLVHIFYSQVEGIFFSVDW